jgi:sulfoxide reductase heme-binding subunit YedZ
MPREAEIAMIKNRRKSSGTYAWEQWLPWLDPAGRFSAFKLVVFILLFVPAAMIAYRFAAGALGPLPVNAAIHQSGNWAIKLILISLAISPARKLLRWPRIMQVRRMVGVAAFAYAIGHLALYLVDQNFDLSKVAMEIVLRVYLTIGFGALLMLTALAITSTDGMVRRLGGKRWRLLHRLTYVTALLAVVHFFMQVKFTVDEPWIMAGLFGWLMAYRTWNWLGYGDSRFADWAPALFAALASIGTAFGEAIYYCAKVGVAPTRVLAANFMFAHGAIRPAWIVLAICLAAASVGLLRRFSPEIRVQARASAI